MRVIGTGSSTIVQALSDCFVVTAGTTYDLKACYLASPPVTISQIGYAATYFSAANCAGSVVSPAGASTGSVIINSGWDSIAGQTTATGGVPFAAQSARLQLNFVCPLATCKDPRGTLSNARPVRHRGQVHQR